MTQPRNYMLTFRIECTKEMGTFQLLCHYLINRRYKCSVYPSLQVTRDIVFRPIGMILVVLHCCYGNMNHCVTFVEYRCYCRWLLGVKVYMLQAVTMVKGIVANLLHRRRNGNLFEPFTFPKHPTLQYLETLRQHHVFQSVASPKSIEPNAFNPFGHT